MKHVIYTLCLLVGFTLSAQEVMKDGKIYEVKKGKIYLEDKDVTETFSPEERAAMVSKLKANTKSDKVKEKQAKRVKKAEKAAKKAEKKQKKAEKALKKKKKAKASRDKYQAKLQKTQNKYERLKSKGKLSPVAEEKMLKKIEKLKEGLAKAERKLDRV